MKTSLNGFTDTSRFIVWTVLLLSLFAVGSCDGKIERRHSHKEDLEKHPEIKDLYIDLAAVNQTLHFHHTLDNPIWQEGQTATHMKDEDLVIGIEVSGQPYALPWWILKNHHIANLILEGQAVVVTLCEMCGSGSAFHATLDNSRLEFRQHGIYKGTWFMRDLQTNSFWLPFEGSSFYGPFKDSTLQNIDAYQVDWHDWLEENPGTMVLYDSQKKREGHGSREYLGYERIADTYRSTLPDTISNAYPMFEVILGVSNRNSHKAYSMKLLDSLGNIINDSLADGSKVVVFHKSNSTMGGAFIPEVDGVQLSFEMTENETIKDIQTGSIWNYFGKCQQGQLAGKSLESYFFITKEWYSWYGYHPDTEVF